jgi:hypothetical protein
MRAATAEEDCRIRTGIARRDRRMIFRNLVPIFGLAIA